MSLSKSMGKHPKIFNSMFVNIIKAGESAGVLDKVLFQLADFIAHDLKLRMGITQAIRYPSIVVGITILVGVFAVTYILPRFSTLFANTRIDFQRLQEFYLVSINFYGLLAGCFCDYCSIVIAIWRILNTKAGRYQWHKILLDLPVFGPIAQKMAISRFCHVLIHWIEQEYQF